MSKTKAPLPDDKEQSKAFIEKAREIEADEEHSAAEIIEAYDLSVTDAAKALAITRAALSAFINKHSALSSEMALRIEKAFGVPMDR